MGTRSLLYTCPGHVVFNFDFVLFLFLFFVVLIFIMNFHCLGPQFIAFSSVVNFLSLVDYCSPNPCKNNGVCVVEEGKGYSCSCNPGFTGFHCQGKENLESQLRQGKRPSGRSRRVCAQFLA